MKMSIVRQQWRGCSLNGPLDQSMGLLNCQINLLVVIRLPNRCVVLVAIPLPDMYSAGPQRMLTIRVNETLLAHLRT